MRIYGRTRRRSLLIALLVAVLIACGTAVVVWALWILDRVLVAY